MGKELSRDFYDKVFKDGGCDQLYHKDYLETPWSITWKIVCDKLKEYVLEDIKILDLGCGPGQFACCAFDNGIKKYTGIDFSSEAIDMAKNSIISRQKKYIKKNLFEEKNYDKEERSFEFICNSVFDEDISKIDYNCIVATEFLEHINEDIECLNLIKSGTIIVATVPNLDSEGHVRFWPQEISVAKSKIIDRYSVAGEFLHISEIKYPIHNSDTQSIDYLFVIKKN